MAGNQKFYPMAMNKDLALGREDGWTGKEI